MAKREHVVIRCVGCGLRIVGEKKEDGRVYASRYPRPDLPETPGYCWTCAPADANKGA